MSPLLQDTLVQLWAWYPDEAEDGEVGSEACQLLTHTVGLFTSHAPKSPK